MQGKILKRQHLPNFCRLKINLDHQKLSEAFQQCPQSFDDLLFGYKTISTHYPHDEASFGLAFNSQEEAEEFCKLHQRPVRISREGSRWRILPESLLYFQMAITEYDGVGDPLLETSYTKLVNWAKGTYFERIINAFGDQVTRVRVARMLPGCHVKLHIDYNTDFAVRYHVAINSGPKSWIRVHNRGSFEELHVPSDGSIWFVNQGWPHEAKNDDEVTRDHLVLSVAGQSDLWRSLTDDTHEVFVE